MSRIINEPRPQGQSKEYRFLRLEGGRQYKAKEEGKVTIDGSPAISFSVAPVDAEGKALLNDLGEPDVTYHTHTFTEFELSLPGFDIAKVAAEKLTQLVENKERILNSKAKIKEFQQQWTGDKPLDLSKPANPA